MLDIAHELQLPTMLNAYTSMYTRKECASCISMDELRMSPKEAARLEMEYLKETKGEDYERYMQEMAAMSLYDTGVTAKYGDRLLTLSTCDSSEENGRFVVVAKRVEE